MNNWVVKQFCRVAVLSVLLFGVGAMLPDLALAMTGGGDEGGDGDRLNDLFKSKGAPTRKNTFGKQKIKPKRLIRKVKRKRKIRKRRVRARSRIKKAPVLAIKRLDYAWWRRPLQGRHVPGEILLTLPGDAPQGTAAKIARENGLRLIGAEQNLLLGETVYFFTYSDARPVPEVIAVLRGAKGVVTAQPNYLYAQQGAKGGGAKARGSYGLQYALKNLHVGEAHDQLLGNNVIVAVIDSAIDLKHPELTGTVVSAFDAIARGGARGGQSHGTGIASIISARGQLTGIAPGARLASVRAFSKSGALGPALSTTRALLRGLDWAWLQKARIFNLSFAGPKDPLFLRALERLSVEGAILIAAAGNEGAGSPNLYPAAAANVIAVTAVDDKDALFVAASQGAYVEVASPGVDILVAAPGSRFGFLSGTSMAAAHVSGLAALILERRPEISADALREILLSTAHDLGDKGRDNRFGAGRANAPAAIKAAIK